MSIQLFVAQIAGLPLEVVENEWVTLRSLFEPFEKDVEKQIERLKGWANLRKVRLPPRSGAEKRAENLPPSETWVLHHEHVAMAIAELDTRGMSEDIRTSFIRFKRECATALHAYFTVGYAQNPRTQQPATELDAIEANAQAVVRMVGEIRESRRIAAEALMKADENSQKIAALSREQQALIERQQTALASIPLLPEPTESTTPRTTRSNVVELLRAVAIQTGSPYKDVTARAYREFKYRENVDIMQRLRNIKKQPGNSRTTGLDVVEQLGHTERFYALCVRLYGLPRNPLPSVDSPEHPVRG